MVQNILAIEPDKVDRHLLKRALAPEFSVITLSSAAEAIAYAKCNTFDVAIINQKLLNHFDGTILLFKLKQLNSSFIPIATTVMVDEWTCTSLTASGFSDTSPLVPEISGRKSHDLFKQAAEIIRIIKAKLRGNVLYGLIGEIQRLGCLLHLHVQEIVDRRKACAVLEKAGKPGRRIIKRST